MTDNTPRPSEHSEPMTTFVTLKWGTLKSWSCQTPRSRELIQRYHNIGSSFSAMAQRDTPEQKQIICELIDESDGDTIYLDWDGKYVPKEDAKKYVLEYGK